MSRTNTFLNMYVIYNDLWKYKGVDLPPGDHIFRIEDIIKSDNVINNYDFFIQSVKISRFNLWVRHSQIILLDDKTQAVAKVLYDV